eukprot:Nk52_evm64s236 gene=Nk52_evmTU64s236
MEKDINALGSEGNLSSATDVSDAGHVETGSDKSLSVTDSAPYQIVSRYDKFVNSATKKDFSKISKFNVLSHGGMDSLGRTIMVFSACNLPPKEDIDLNELLEYCIVTLDRIVESDYCLVYFHACMDSNARPPLSWFRKCYRILSRKYKKNLKALYIVHPTLWIRLLMGFFKPFVSYKFWDKIVTCHSLSELRPSLPLNQLTIPSKVLDYDAKVHPHSCIKYAPEDAEHYDLENALEKRQFGAALGDCRLGQMGMPVVVEVCVAVIKEHGLYTEGIFRRSAKHSRMKALMDKFNHGIIPTFEEFSDVHLWATVLKSFLRELREPLLTFNMFEDVVRLSDIHDSEEQMQIVRLLFKESAFPALNFMVLFFLIEFLHEVSKHSDINLMTMENLSIVVGPSLLWSKTEPANLYSISKVNRFVHYLINFRSEIFQGQQQAPVPKAISNDQLLTHIKERRRSHDVTTSNINLLNSSSVRPLEKGELTESDLSLNSILTKSGKQPWTEAGEESPGARRRARKLREKEALPGKPIAVTVTSANDHLYRSLLRPGYKSTSEIAEKNAKKPQKKKKEKSSDTGSAENLKDYTSFVNSKITEQLPKGPREKKKKNRFDGSQHFDIDWSASGEILVIEECKQEFASQESASSCTTLDRDDIGYTEYVSQKHRKLFEHT